MGIWDLKLTQLSCDNYTSCSVAKSSTHTEFCDYSITNVNRIIQFHQQSGNPPFYIRVYPTLACEFQAFKVWGKFVFRTQELTDTPTNLANQVTILTNDAESNRADLRERTKTMRRHWDRRGQIGDFRDSFERIKWLYLLSKCGIKTKTHFEWLLWHWSNGLVGCKVPTELVKISVKEATHMGFYYIVKRTTKSPLNTKMSPYQHRDSHHRPTTVLSS